MASFTKIVKAVAHADSKKIQEDVSTIDLRKVFKRHGLFPAIIETRDTKGIWPLAGSNRQIVFSDGSTAREYIKYYDAPFFSYIVKFEKGLFFHLCDHIDGFWSFCETYKGTTSVRWEYEFFARSRAAAPVLWFITTFLWPAYMRLSLNNCLIAD